MRLTTRPHVRTRRRPLRSAGVATAVGLVAAGIGVTAAPPGQSSPRPVPVAHGWVTTPDGAEQMHDRGTVAFKTGGSDRLTITVDPSLRYQTMDGVGASITDSSASVLMELSPSARDATMRDLFGTDGLSFLRQPVGSSDFVDGPHYTYDDVAPGGTDYDLSEFSIAHDEAQILPLVRQALALNPSLKVMATPWSPPAWMKTNDSLVGGRFKDDPRVYDAYARYFVRFIQDYRRAGVPIDAVTLQNEPQNRNPSAYPGMDLRDSEEARLVVAVGRAFQRAAIHTKILGYDHNWSLH